MNEEILKKVRERSAGQWTGWSHLAPPGWTTLIEIDGWSDSIDSVTGFPSIAGLDPLHASPLLRKYVEDSKRDGRRVERVVTFYERDDLRRDAGYDVEIATWIIEPAGDVEPFEACAIGYWIAAYRDKLSPEQLQSVMDMLPGETRSGDGWSVRRGR